MDLLSNLITNIRVDTVWGPPIVLDQPFAASPEPNPFLSLMKPKITVGVAGGSPLTIAPYGEPGDSKWPFVELFMAAGALALLYLGMRRL